MRVGRCGCMLGGGGRLPGRIRRRAARGRLLEFLLCKPSNSIKRHNCPFCWLTRDIALGLVPPSSGPDFRYTNFSGGRGFAFCLHTLFRAAGVFAFYLHTLCGRPGFLHFTYTHVFDNNMGDDVTQNVDFQKWKTVFRESYHIY